MSHIRLVFILLLTLVLETTAFAEVKRIAVLEFRGVDIEQTYLLKLSDQSRSAALEVLGTDDYLIMTRENIHQVLSDMGKDIECVSGECEVETGRNIGADYVVTGDIMRIDEVFVLTIKLYDTSTGGLLSTQVIQAEKMLEMYNSTLTQSKALVENGLQIKKSLTF